MGTCKGKKWSKSKKKSESEKCVYKVFTINPKVWSNFVKIFSGNRSKFISDNLERYVEKNKKK